MSQNYIDFARMESLTARECTLGVSYEHNMMKLTEETGELAQALLAFLGSHTASASASDSTREHVLEECCDVINNAMNILNRLNVSNEEAKAMFDRKLSKWENKLSRST